MKDKQNSAQWSRYAAYASIGIPESMLLYAASIVIPGFYATEMGLSAAAIGGAMILARLFDAGSDIAVGHLSDRTISRWGPRKPWLVAGALLCTIATAFLFAPPDEPTMLYYLGWTLALYLGWTMAIVPFDAWGAEISKSYDERSRIFSARAVAYYIGSIIFVASPYLPIFETTAFTREVMAFNVWLIGILFALTLIVALYVVPAAPPRSAKAPSFRSLFGSIRDNRPMQMYLVIYAVGGLDLGVFMVMTYIFIVSYLGLAEVFPLVLVVYILANFLFLPFWYVAIRRFGKHRAWAIGVFGSGLCYPLLAFAEPGSVNLVVLMVLIGVAGALYTVNNIAERAVLADIIDYDQLRTGKNRAANYFALKSFILKAGIAIGGGCAFLALDAVDFDPASSDNTASSIIGMKIIYLFIPTIMKGASTILMWRFPIDARRHRIIRRRLDQREAIENSCEQ